MGEKGGELQSGPPPYPASCYGRGVALIAQHWVGVEVCGRAPPAEAVDDVALARVRPARHRLPVQRQLPDPDVQDRDRVVRAAAFEPVALALGALVRLDLRDALREHRHVEREAAAVAAAFI